MGAAVVATGHSHLAALQPVPDGGILPPNGAGTTRSGMAKEQAPQPEATPAKDVFISYASQDKAVADALCESLESAGVSCWIAPRDVTPGEFYAESIVHAIDSTRVIVLILSRNGAASPHVLREVERASSKRHPVLSFRIDASPLPAALEYFLNSSQWLDASAAGVAQSLSRLVDAVKSTLGQPAAEPRLNVTPSAVPRAGRRSRRLFVASAVIVAVALTYFLADKFWLAKHAAAEQPDTVAASPAPSFTPPPHSIAVLPFVNMSGDAKQDYFSDGISEELLDALSRVDQLQVAARTSSFSFKGQNADVSTIAFCAIGAPFV